MQPRADYYEDHHPTAADTLLVIELSDSTLRFDRDVKAPLYGEHEVPEVWVIDLNENRLVRFRRPADGGEPVASKSGLGPVALDALPLVALDLEPLLTRTPQS